MSGVRIDKWLWSVRIYKSRTISTDACKSGRIRIKDVTAKPSTLVEEGQIVHVRKDGFNLEFKILKLIDKRVGAPIAQTCYENLTPAEELNKYQDWFIGKGKIEQREKGVGRPTKRQRREIDSFKGDLFEDSAEAD
ncbi:MAG: RNA-binding S4 domain-containing protein [Saprospiraceae bacterium]|nr:RNA-binding S4 domain-containing protein [Saprospiraceae bacterium]